MDGTKKGVVPTWCATPSAKWTFGYCTEVRRWETDWYNRDLAAVDFDKDQGPEDDEREDELEEEMASDMQEEEVDKEIEL